MTGLDTGSARYAGFEPATSPWTGLGTVASTLYRTELVSAGFTRVSIHAASAVLILALLSGCTHAQPKDPTPPNHILIPLSVADTDWICAETPPKVVHNYCVPVREFRLWVQPSVRADP